MTNKKPMDKATEDMIEAQAQSYAASYTRTRNDANRRNCTAENPKAQYGAAKPSISEVPLEVIFELGAAMREGGRKYGRHNYLATEIAVSTYYDAIMRHLGAFWMGEDTDPDSGVPHITKAMACLVVLRASQMHGTSVDDRPPAAPLDFWPALCETVRAIDARYPNPADPYTEAEAQEDEWRVASVTSVDVSDPPFLAPEKLAETWAACDKEFDLPGDDPAYDRDTAAAHAFLSADDSAIRMPRDQTAMASHAYRGGGVDDEVPLPTRAFQEAGQTYRNSQRLKFKKRANDLHRVSADIYRAVADIDETA